jgi:hypothetical protein
MPGTEDRDREEDEAYVILRGLGLNADSYFRAESSHSLLPRAGKER